MKIWKIVGIGLLLVAPAAFAVDTSSEATARVKVKSVFRLSLDRSDINFREMEPGQTREEIPESGIRVTTFSNTGNQWFLKINALSELKNGVYSIPNSNFKWYGWTEGAGTWHGTGDDNIQLSPTLVYTSTGSEGASFPNGVQNFFKFKLNVPKSQRAGDYETIVRFTITE